MDYLNLPKYKSNGSFLIIKKHMGNILVFVPQFVESVLRTVRFPSSSV